jgi:DNA-binding transcriptional LysR family regulator
LALFASLREQLPNLRSSLQLHKPDLATLETFVAVVESGSLSRAAEKLETTAGAVSRRLSALEERLGLRLLNRTTRKLSLTEAGEQYFRDLGDILQALTEAEDRITHLSAAPAGNLRVAAPLTFGERALAPLLPEFLGRFPGLRLSLDLDDRLVDILAVGADVALRIGPLSDSSLVARPIAEIWRVLCASPGYLEGNGEPTSAADLARHACLHYSNLGLKEEWTLIGPAGSESVEVTGPLCANNGDVLRKAALGGLGIVSLPEFIVADDLRSGRLRQVLAGYATAPLTLSALWPSRRFLPAKVRVFVDFLVERLGAGAAPASGAR